MLARHEASEALRCQALVLPESLLHWGGRRAKPKGGSWHHGGLQCIALVALQWLCWWHASLLVHPTDAPFLHLLLSTEHLFHPCVVF